MLKFSCNIVTVHILQHVKNFCCGCSLLPNVEKSLQIVLLIPILREPVFLGNQLWNRSVMGLKEVKFPMVSFNRI